MKRREMVLHTLAGGLFGAAFRCERCAVGSLPEPVLDAFKLGLREHGW